MKKLLLGLALSAFTLFACNINNDKPFSAKNLSDSSMVTPRVSPFTSPVNGILQIYLQMKNDLVNDDSNGAATAGKTMVLAINEFDKSILRDNEMKIFEDLTADAKENAEYIGEKAGDIKHQRELFGRLSKAMYELIKTSAAGERIYVDYCPMFNDKKEAIWLSETVEIKNPYFGNTMLTCGKITEKIQ